MNALLKVGFRYIYRSWLAAKTDVQLERLKADLANYEADRRYREEGECETVEGQS